MTGAFAFLGTFIFGIFIIIVWNRQRVKGKILGMIIRRDKSVLPKLLELRDDFVIWGTRAYELYPDFIRICRFPMGWPAFMQELVPAILLDEDDRTPLDWINLSNRQGSAMELRAALDENWVRKLVEESSKEPGIAGKFNWKKVLPILVIAGGVIGLIVMLYLRSKKPTAGLPGFDQMYTYLNALMGGIL